jgi:L-carnitine CoA-transferase
METNQKMPVFGMLSGYRVVMMGASVAAPFAGELYAENGADVIWIEHPTIVDSARIARKSGSWQQDRRNMRSLAMNYTKDEGQEVFLKLMETTDVLIEASIGGRFARMGLSDEVLWEHNPKLVIAHISGFGQTGVPEFVQRASYDPIAQAFGCVMRMNGLPGQPSTPAMPFPADYTASFYAFGLSLAALLKRNETGKGESLDIAQFELMMRLQANYPTDYLRYGLDYIKEGNHSRICAGYGTYCCKDGNEIYMLFLNTGVLERGLPILGLEYGSELFPEGSSFVPVDTPAAEMMEAAIEKFCSEHTAEEAESLLCANGVPCSRLLNYEDAVNHPHYQAREVFTTWTAADGKTQIPGVNIVPKIKNNPGQIWRGAPNIGMDNEDILRELGIPRAIIDKMYAENKLGKRKYFESK